MPSGGSNPSPSTNLNSISWPLCFLEKHLKIVFMVPTVRFAPSPTGQLHIGGVRTALFNYAFAKKFKGSFLLRIEDTDKARSKDKYTEQILESLSWLGLEFDDEPLKQSSRFDRYKEVINHLIDTGNAYRCFASNEELEHIRQQSGSYLYPRIWRDRSKEEVDAKLLNKDEHTIRMRIPVEGDISFKDLVYGKINTKFSELDDFIIARSDGSPTYNLTVVVDDNDMNISHVIRGEDHISNTPKQMLIYKALGWTIPKFGHLPMILGSDGKRLSKRHGAKGTSEYKDLGYLPDTLINYLALLGWNPGNNDEIFDFNYLQENFSLDKVNKKSAVFDTTKLEWVSSQNIFKISSAKLVDIVSEFDPTWCGEGNSLDYLVNVIDLIKDRIKTLSDIKENSFYFFNHPIEYDESAMKKCWGENTKDILNSFQGELSNLNDWNSSNIDESINKCVNAINVGKGKLMQPLRIALTGALIGPSIPDLMNLLGKETCLIRIKNILKNS
ncbi:MAG: glutamate--tRNA ligase [bacterium TMED80]|nr:MAG: glutamate--tRNA ligase [bacterium TMED80]